MPTMFAALRHRDYRFWTAAGFLSVTGTWMQVLGVNWYVLQTTGSAARMGVVVLLQALPVLLLGSLGGTLADRLPARALLIATQAGHGLLALALVGLALRPEPDIAIVYALSLAGGFVGAFEGPVMGVYGASLVDRATLGNALALNSIVSSAGRILGMSAGGVLVAVLGTAPLFALNAVSFIAVIAVIAALRPRHDHTEDAAAGDPPAPGGVRAGLAYLRRRPLILITLAVAFVLGSLGRNYQITMAAMSDGPLGTGAAGYGILSTVFAVGTVVGGLAAAKRSFLGYRTLIGAGLIASVLQIAAGLAPGLPTFAAAILPVAAAAVLIDTTVSARAQLDTDRAMRGRVLAAIAVVGSVSSAVGAPLLGWLAETVGPRQTLTASGLAAAGACVAAGAALARRRGRRIGATEVRITLRESIGADTRRLRHALATRGALAAAEEPATPTGPIAPGSAGPGGPHRATPTGPGRQLPATAGTRSARRFASRWRRQRPETVPAPR